MSVRPWLGTKAGGGGVLLAQAIHPGYVLRWVLGDLAEVTGVTSARKVVDMTAEGAGDHINHLAQRYTGKDYPGRTDDRLIVRLAPYRVMGSERRQPWDVTANAG